ncbi:MAG: hypothetical protein AAFU79_25665 [Myxococcota bacterium]
MTSRRFVPNAGLGMLDLVFLLCLLFFLTTVLSVRRMAFMQEVADEEAAGPKRPVVVSLDPSGPRFELISAGDRPGPGSGPLEAWLAVTCAASPTPVEVACPEDATHAECKRGLLALRSAARDCAYRY